MIGFLEGTVRGVVRDTVVVMTPNGIGYGAYVPAATLARVQEDDTLALWTHLAVRENAHDLYGFETREELRWFELLLTVSGVGPRSALSILNAVDTASLERAIASRDASILSQAYGIGKKTAEKIVLELKEKVVPVGQTHEAGGEVVEVLVALGYSAKEARDAVQALPKDLTTTADKVREALRYASRN